MIRVVDKPDHEIELTARLKISDLALTIHYFMAMMYHQVYLDMTMMAAVPRERKVVK